MNDSTALHISGYRQLKQLRTALAILQGTKLLSTLKQEAEATVSHDQSKRVTYLTMLFSRIHRTMFHDWMDQATVSHRPGTMTDAGKRQRFRKIIARLVLDDEGNRDSAIFDNNGFVIGSADIAERLARFYLQMRAVRPFAYGNRITLDFFMTMLGNLPAFKGVYQHGIDFRRLDGNDAISLHDPESDLTTITTAFSHALDGKRARSLPNPANGYGRWPENKRFVSGIPFLSHTTDAGIECLVSVNGGLVPLANIQDELFLAGKHLADYPLSASENVIGYIPGTENLRTAEKKSIDGIAIGENGAAPLFCLDINMLTGLRSPSHMELLELIRQCAGEQSDIFALANNAALKIKLLHASSDDIRLQRTVEIAYNRLNGMHEKLDAALEELFQGKTADVQPKLFMAMGGAGSGKSAVEEIARAQCGDNFVIASLDEFRKQSDLYQVLTAANHHSDDYVYVEPFANRLRNLVAERARRAGINLLFDGTGISYQPRYAAIVRQFKDAGFHTRVTAVDAFLVDPAAASGAGEPASAVISRVKDRYRKTGRALPWVVTIDKHIRAPVSFLAGLEDRFLDKITLFANDRGKDQHYLVAESFTFSEREVQLLHQHQKAGSLAEYLQSLSRNHDDSIIRQIAAGERSAIDALLGRNPDFGESNIAYQIYSHDAGNRVLIIYNTRRMVGFLEKRQLNPHSSNQQGLLHKPELLAFHVDPDNPRPWSIRLQGPEKDF